MRSDECNIRVKPRAELRMAVTSCGGKDGREGGKRGEEKSEVEKHLLLASMECASRSVEDDDQRQVKD